MKVESYISLNSEKRINTQFEHTSTYNTKSDKSTKRLVLLPTDWDENGSLITKQLHIMMKIICHSQQEPLRTVFSFVVYTKQVSVYNFWQVELETESAMRKESKSICTVRRSL